MKINTQNCIDEIKRKYSDKISGKWKRNKKFSAYFNNDICTIRIFTNTKYPTFMVYSVETEDNNLITVLLEEVEPSLETFKQLLEGEGDSVKDYKSVSDLLESYIHYIDTPCVPKIKHPDYDVDELEMLDFENFIIKYVKGNRVKAFQGGDWQAGMDVVYGFYKNIDNNKLELYLLEFLLFDNDAE